MFLGVQFLGNKDVISGQSVNQRECHIFCSLYLNEMGRKSNPTPEHDGHYIKLVPEALKWKKI